MSCRWLFPLFLFSLLFGGCPGDDDDSGDDDSGAADGDDDAGDDDSAPGDDDEPFVPQLPTGGCGGHEYGWASMERMGEIVDWDEPDGYAFTAEALEILLEGNGYGGWEPQYDVRVFLVRYITQDRGEEVEATAWASFPVLEEEEEVPTVAWFHGTSGFTDECAPTAMGLEGALGNILLSTLGYAVIAPDYLGMNGWGEPAGFLHPYVVAEPTAVASLDSLRALQRFHDEAEDDVKARPSLRTVLWGGSEGGFAAMWADRYAPGYAPEFDVVASLALVPPTDSLGLATHGTTIAGPTTAALAAVLVTAHDWYGAEGSLHDVLTDEDPSWLASALPGALADGCDAGGLFDDLDSIEQIYVPSFAQAASTEDWAAIEPFSCYLRQSTIHATEIPRDNDTPTLFVVSGEDTLVAADVVRDDFVNLCGDGYRLEYLECAGASHSEGAVDSLPYQREWVAARLSGETLEGACVPTEPLDCAEEFGLSGE